MSDRPTSFHDFKWACGHTGPGYCKTCRDDEIERLQARVEVLEAVKEAAQESLECLYFHGFEPGEDPRISNLAGAMLVADGTLAATEQGESK